MGLLRFLLATLVLASHLGHTVAGLNPGVVAVVVFYLLAGQVVAGLWAKWQGAQGGLGQFYADRLWRVLPQYYLVLLACALLWASGQLVSPFVALAPGLAAWAANLTVVPLSYYMYTGLEGFVLVPPAWSLGVELQFYLLAPLLVAQSGRVLLAAMLGSGAVFVAAQVGWLNTDHFGYRLLPGVLFIFLAGAALRRPAWHPWLVALGLGFASYFVALLAWGRHQPYDREVALGLALGLPTLLLLGHHHLPAILAPLDRALAHLSYGVFVWHFPALWLLGLQPPALGWAPLLQVFALSVLAAGLTHLLIERPLWRCWRHMIVGTTQNPMAPL